MATCHCCVADQHFDERRAQGDLRRFQTHGPDPWTRHLLAAIQQCALPPGATLLDVGGGIGAIPHALLDHGFAQATLVDASGAFLQVAAAESHRRGHQARLLVAHGDFATVAPTLPAATVVTLDRVVCCDPDYAGLLGAAAERAQQLLTYTYPRRAWYTRLQVTLENGWRRLRGRAFRTFIHPPAAMRGVLEAHGLRRRWVGGTWIWRAELYERAA